MMKLLALLATLVYVAVAIQRLRARWTARIDRLISTVAAPMGYAVTIENPGGRAGRIEYRQDGDVCRLDWELLGGRTAVLQIWGPDRARWDREVPWAAGRRDAVLARVAEEVVRQKCPACRWEIADDGIRLYEAASA